MSDALAPSVEYPAKVFFHTPIPDTVLAQGYDSFRVERRKTPSDAWEPVTPVPPAAPAEFRIVSGTYNYHYVDARGRRGYQYRAVLQNSVTPGTPPDQPQGAVNGVNANYESVMTIKELKEIYLWGEDDAFITQEGLFQPDYTFAHALRYGIEKVQKKLDIKLLPTRVVEFHDWVPESMHRGYLSLVLDEYPLINVESLTLKLPGAPDYVFPADWLRVLKEGGHLDVVPSGSASASLPRIRGYVPQVLEVVYFAGFPLGECPDDLKEVVGKEGAFGPLNVGGDLVGGAGLAGTSLSMDGVSQSITTTNSSTNAGFGARLIQYEKELRETYKTLRGYYKGIRMQVA